MLITLRYKNKKPHHYWFIGDYNWFYENSCPSYDEDWIWVGGLVISGRLSPSLGDKLVWALNPLIIYIEISPG
jgi:hypothetical protein